MKSVRSSLVLLSVCAYALAAPATTPLPSQDRSIVEESGPSVISSENVETTLNRDKKSAPGTCVTVTEPYKAPFTLCNSDSASALSNLAHEGGVALPKHLDNGGITATSHLGGGVFSGVQSPHPHIGVNSVGFHSSGGGSGPQAHFGGGGVLTPFHHNGGFAGPQVAVHPSLHTTFASNGGYPGVGFGLARPGIQYGGQRFIPGYGFLPNQFGLQPAYGQFSYGGAPFGQFRENENEEFEAPTFPEESGQESGTGAPKHGSQGTTGDVRAAGTEEALAAAAIDEDLAAQVMEQARRAHVLSQQALAAQLDQAMEGRARSALLGPSYAPLPPDNGYLEGVPAAVSMFPHGVAGGGCGALPLLFSCSPHLVRGHLAPAGVGGGYYQVSTPWAGGAAVNSGAVYRQSEDHTAPLHASPSTSIKDSDKTDSADKSKVRQQVAQNSQ